MIAKTTIGRSFKGCCAYNLAKVEQGQGEILLSQGVRDYDQRAMVADFTRQAKMNPDLTRSVWHTAVSFSPQDEARLQTNPELMKQVAGDYLRGMGLDGSQYVVIRHRDTDHSHFHIIANRVANDGQTVSDSHNFSRSEQLSRQLEEKYGLTPMIEQERRQRLEKLPERDRQRIEMRDQVRACVKVARSGQQLQAELSRHGIRMLINRDRVGQARGVSFERSQTDERGEMITTAFKGSKLHTSLGMGQIAQQLKHNQEHKERQEQNQALRNEPKPQNEPKRGFGRSM